MEFVDAIHRLDLIIEHTTRLKTLLNKKWYDEQDLMLLEVNRITDEARTLKSLMEFDENAEKKRNSLYNICDIFTNCTKCPFYEKTATCPISNDRRKHEKLGVEQVGYLYDKMKTWVESFLIE